jgi:hypothetical protein
VTNDLLSWFHDPAFRSSVARVASRVTRIDSRLACGILHDNVKDVNGIRR